MQTIVLGIVQIIFQFAVARMSESARALLEAWYPTWRAHCITTANPWDDGLSYMVGVVLGILSKSDPTPGALSMSQRMALIDGEWVIGTTPDTSKLPFGMVWTADRPFDPAIDQGA